MGSVDVGPRGRSTAPHILEQAVKAHGKMLFSTLTRICTSGVLVFGMAALCRRLLRWSHNYHRSSDIDSPIGKANPFPDSDTLGSVGSVSVNQTNHKNISQEKEVLPPMPSAKTNGKLQMQMRKIENFGWMLTITRKQCSHSQGL